MTDDSTIINGYVLTHPHDPYEGAAEIHINQFDGGANPWQAQVYADGSLVEAEYFTTEEDALRWASREMTLIACVAKAEAAPDTLAELRKAESFISGFEDDELQEGIAELLSSIRAAIAKADGRV